MPSICFLRTLQLAHQGAPKTRTCMLFLSQNLFNLIGGDAEVGRDGARCPTPSVGLPDLVGGLVRRLRWRGWRWWGGGRWCYADAVPHVAGDGFEGVAALGRYPLADL